MSDTAWWHHQWGPTARFLDQELFDVDSPLGLVCTPTTLHYIYSNIQRLAVAAFYGKII